MKRKKPRKRRGPPGRPGVAGFGAGARGSGSSEAGRMQKAVHYHQSGHLEKARRLYEKIIKANPKNADCLHLLGLIAHQLGNHHKAANLIERALEIDPKNPVYHNSLGVALDGFGNSEAALASFKKAVALKPGYAKAHSNMGNVLLRRRMLAQAVSSFQKALQLDPCLAETYCDMGRAFQEQDNLDQAIVCYQKGLKLNPGDWKGYNDLGNALRNQGNFTEAMGCYRQALEIRPGAAGAVNNLVALLQRTCAWDELEPFSAKLDVFTKQALKHGTKPREIPFVSLVRTDAPYYNLALAKAWSLDIARSMAMVGDDFAFSNRRSKKRITVGYLSSDFRNHPVAHLITRLFTLHDRHEFEVFCYSYGKDDGSHYRERISKDCDKFVDLRELGHVEAARLINEDQVDILVDLNGHTEGNRLEILALRPAPVQVTYLGFPGSTGAQFIDYIITDRVVMPERREQCCTENPVYMPHCYMVTDNTQKISNIPREKARYGLAEDCFIFCSFNQAYKIDRQMFSVWMDILKQVPQGVLWLQQLNQAARDNLKREAEEKGIELGRIVFGEKLASKADHLARISTADLALDTMIYNGHATTIDSLWAGVPVITLEGRHFASRVSSSALAALGLSELITHTMEDYKALAIRLAKSPDELQGVRTDLAGNRFTEPLFGTERFTQHLEDAYREMWEIFLSGNGPRPICVQDD